MCLQLLILVASDLQLFVLEYIEISSDMLYWDISRLRTRFPNILQQFSTSMRPDCSCLFNSLLKLLEERHG
jgi:hypothetical protein